MAKLNDTDRWNVSRFDGQIEPIMVKLKLVFEN
jgi:hypothetical protein